MGQFGAMLVISTVLIGGASDRGSQSVPNFSGNWTLTQSDAGPKGQVSGAAVNCGTECTIIQTVESLTVSRPAAEDGKKFPDGVVALAGKATGSTSAKWDGDKLVLTRAIVPTLAVTQTLSLRDGQLVIDVAVSDKSVGPFKLTYSKK